MNTREDDGPAANDNDDDDEMWWNVELTNEEINVIKDTNFKFLFAGKHSPANIQATRLHSRIFVAFCFSIRVYSRDLKQIFAGQNPVPFIMSILLNRPCHGMRRRQHTSTRISSPNCFSHTNTNTEKVNNFSYNQI